MDTKKIIESLAKKFEGDAEWSDNDMTAFFQIRGSIPVVVRKGHCVDGIQWFHLDVFLGKVIDQGKVPLHTLLYKNSSGHGNAFFALQDVGGIPWIVLRDPYALSETMADKDVTDILAIRLAGSAPHFVGIIPGVEYCEGFR